MDKKITLHLSIEDCNTILEALGGMPFKQVFRIIGEIQNQAAEQLKSEQNDLEIKALNEED